MIVISLSFEISYDFDVVLKTHDCKSFARRIPEYENQPICTTLRYELKITTPTEKVRYKEYQTDEKTVAKGAFREVYEPTSEKSPLKNFSLNFVVMTEKKEMFSK